MKNQIMTATERCHFLLSLSIATATWKGRQQNLETVQTGVEPGRVQVQTFNCVTLCAMTHFSPSLALQTVARSALTCPRDSLEYAC